MPLSEDTKIKELIINETTEELLKADNFIGQPNQLYITSDDFLPSMEGATKADLETKVTKHVVQTIDDKVIYKDIDIDGSNASDMGSINIWISDTDNLESENVTVSGMQVANTGVAIQSFKSSLNDPALFQLATDSSESTAALTARKIVISSEDSTKNNLDAISIESSNLDITAQNQNVTGNIQITGTAKLNNKNILIEDDIRDKLDKKSTYKNITSEISHIKDYFTADDEDATINGIMMSALNNSTVKDLLDGTANPQGSYLMIAQDAFRFLTQKINDQSPLMIEGTNTESSNQLTIVSGITSINSDKISLSTSGGAGILIGQVSGDTISLGGKVNISNNTNINGDLTISGNIIQNGSAYITHAEQVNTKKDYIIMREGATGSLGTGYSGFEFTKYDGVNNGRLVIDANGVARVGDVGDEQPLATREENPINNGFARWNNASSKFITTTISSSMLIDSDTLVKKASLSTVATSGSYNDLSDKPTIPAINTTLTSTSDTETLAASQGKALNDKITTLNTNYTNLNSAAVKITGNQSIAGNKTLSGTTTFNGNAVFNKTLTINCNSGATSNPKVAVLTFTATKTDGTVVTKTITYNADTDTYEL